MINKKVLNEARAIIGSALRRFRVAKNLTQTEAAELIGVTKNTISKIELGQFNYGIDIIMEMSIIYGFTLNFEMKEIGDNSHFLFQNGKHENTYVVTDTLNGVVCVFEKNKFNTTQNFTFLNEIPLNLPTIMREIGDWLAVNYGDFI